MLDLAFISLLVYTSGGPFSQLRFAFFLVPLMAAAILTPRMTLLVSGLAVSAFATIALVYPTTGVAGARTFELAQLAYLAVAALAAFLLAVVLERRRAAIEELAESRRQLVAQALDAEDRERRRLAEALHDEAMQSAARDPPGAGRRARRPRARPRRHRPRRGRPAVGDLRPASAPARRGRPRRRAGGRRGRAPPARRRARRGGRRRGRGHRSTTGSCSRSRAS